MKKVFREQIIIGQSRRSTSLALNLFEERCIMGHRKLKAVAKNKGVYLYDFDLKKYVYLCRHLEVKEVKTDIVTGKVFIVLKYYQNGYREITIPREHLTKSKLLNMLPKYGLDVSDINICNVLHYLMYSEEQADYTLTHSKSGWCNVGREEVYLHNEVLGSNIVSRYNGELAIKPMGTLADELNIYNSKVVGNKHLELALILGLSAPVSSYFREITNTNVQFYNIYGESTTGKTTALMLATAPFGMPSKSKEGLIKTWLATDNAIIGYLRNNHGLPVAIDEASVRGNKSYTNLIYQIVDGIDKARLQGDMEMRERQEWSGTVLSTAENSLLKKSNHNNGLRVRLMEFGNLQWTNSAEEAEELKELLQSNYGNVGIEFVKHFIDSDDEDLMNEFELIKEEVKEMIVESDEFTHRVVNKIAIVALTAKLAKDYLGLCINYKSIIRLLLKFDKEQIKDRQIDSKALEYVKGEITRNINKFIHKVDETILRGDKKVLPSGEILGRLEKNNVGKYNEAWIPRPILETMLLRGGFTDVNVILNKWRDKKIISCDKDKYTKKRMLVKGISQRVVVINIANI